MVGAGPGGPSRVGGAIGGRCGIGCMSAKPAPCQAAACKAARLGVAPAPAPPGCPGPDG